MDCALIPAVGELEIVRTPTPAPDGDGVLVRVRLCGVCGTDLQILAGRFPVPFPYSPGHEIVGEVAGIGDRVEGIRVGDRVAIDPNYACGSCLQCAAGRPNLCLNRRVAGRKSNGGFAEYCAVPRSLVHPLPPGLGWREAVLAEPLSCALHAVETAGIAAGEPAVLIGCGTMGLLSLLLAKRRGARPIVASDPVARKRELAAKLGADVAWDPSRGSLSAAVRETAPDGAAVVIDNVGVEPTIGEGFRSLRPGGTLVLAGIDSSARALPIDPIAVTEREIRIQGTFLNPGTFAPALAQLRQMAPACSCLVTHEFPLADLARAFETARGGDAVKVVVGSG
jgi:L-iditol 2-dehydrogenase